MRCQTLKVTSYIEGRNTLVYIPLPATGPSFSPTSHVNSNTLLSTQRPFSSNRDFTSDTHTHTHPQRPFTNCLFRAKLAVLTEIPSGSSTNTEKGHQSQDMVRVLTPTSENKGSINFLLNSTPASSLDCKNLSAFAHQPSQGFDQLLNAASLLGKRSLASATSSETTSKYTADGHSVTSGEVVQSLKTKKRKRKDIECKICGRTFGDSSSARKHHRVVHLKIKEFKCEECGKTFAEKSNRSKHYIAAHLNQRSHPCPDCDKVFNFTDGLRRHRNNVHLGLRPYPCDLCNTSYKQKTHLLKHKQSVHGIPLPPKRKN